MRETHAERDALILETTGMCRIGVFFSTIRDIEALFPD